MVYQQFANGHCALPCAPRTIGHVGVREAAEQGESEMQGKPDVLMVRPVEAAAMLSISRSSVYELIASGALPSVRIGGRMVRVPVAAIRRMVDQAQPTTDDAQ